MEDKDKEVHTGTCSNVALRTRTLPSPLISPTGPLRMCQSVHLDVPVFDAGAGMSQLPLSSLSETMERDGVRDGGEANEKGREGKENERGQLENTFL